MSARAWDWTDPPPPAPPAPILPCDGSGQAVAPWAPAASSCPICGRLVRVDPYALALVEHYPPDAADRATPTLGL